jgi:hypothetical protein
LTSSQGPRTKGARGVLPPAPADQDLLNDDTRDAGSTSSVILTERRHIDDDGNDSEASAGSFYQHSENVSPQCSRSASPGRAHLRLEKAPLPRKKRSYPVLPPKDWSTQKAKMLEEVSQRSCSRTSSQSSKASSRSSKGRKVASSQEQYAEPEPKKVAKADKDASAPSHQDGKSIFRKLLDKDLGPSLKQSREVARAKEEIYALCDGCDKHKRLKLTDSLLLCHSCYAIQLTGGSVKRTPRSLAAASSGANSGASFLHLHWLNNQNSPKRMRRCENKLKILQISHQKW